MTAVIETSTKQGRILGVREREVCCFRAIPYAQPPVGDLRFCPPETARWIGTLDARQPGPVAPQLPSRLRDAMGDFEAPQSEDCLHLTVWTPAVDQRRRPVLVWLHGGAWQSGAGALDWYSGARLAARGDLVVVAPNYRLGPLGWMAIPGATANLGLLDQEAALDWVFEHIECFGGDPTSVTVMGQSAGAMNIACMLMRKPGFQKAILQSASLGRGFRSIGKAHEVAECFLGAAGAASLQEARQLPVHSLLEAQRAPAVIEWLAAEGAQRSLFGPVADGQVLPLNPEETVFRAAASADVMVGYNLDEMAAFPGQGLHDKSRALGELIYGQPARHWARDASAQGRKAWFYRFDHRANETFGACHCAELPYVFNTLPEFAMAPMCRGVSEQDASRLGNEMQESWISFVRDGDPGWAAWPQQKIFL